MSTVISTQDYTALLNDVRDRIRGAQLQALRAVNREFPSRPRSAARPNSPSRTATPSTSSSSATSTANGSSKRRSSHGWSRSYARWAGCSRSSAASSGWRSPTRSTSSIWFLYHRALRSLVALELKIGEFQPEYVGKMQFYLAVLDDTARLPGENPAIGIILCKTKDETVVEYALRESNKPIGVASYHTVRELPQELRPGLGPGPDRHRGLPDLQPRAVRDGSWRDPLPGIGSRADQQRCGQRTHLRDQVAVLRRSGLHRIPVGRGKLGHPGSR